MLRSKEIISVKTNSLKRRFIIFAIFIIIPIATSNVISLIIAKKINGNYNTMQNKMSTTNEIKNFINDSFNSFNNYIQTNASESKSQYDNKFDLAIQDVVKLQSDSDERSRYVLRDLLNTLRSYKDSGDNTTKKYDMHGAIDTYYSEYMSTKEVLSYCNTFISKLSDSYLTYNNEVYTRLKEKEKFIYKILFVYIISALLISIINTFYFIKNILDKLKELVDTSKRVADGDFTYEEGKRTYIYELDILSDAFSSMISHIKKYIKSLKETAELERKLRDEEMTLLKYQNALKLSQLKILQAQINPHFLFNTLNCINQTAIQENAERTESLIKSVSDILRYSLSMMNRNATLEEEVNVVKQYMYIQESRYQDRVKFNLEINMDLSQVKVPGMTLQPFVENAFIHGIEPKEEGGVININIYKKEDLCIVIIEDSGCGIDEDTLIKITSEDYEQEHIGHTTGMGIKSVVKRLELLYDEKDIFFIESEEGIGTRIYLKIPIRELKEVC